MEKGKRNAYVKKSCGIFPAAFLQKIRKYKFDFENCPAPAPSPSSRFGPPDEVKERLHLADLQRFSGLTKALALFLL
jgi:hypothetical protein